jgi:hypothetical protein
MRPRIFLISLVTAILAYTVYWLVVSAHFKSRIAEWIEARKLEGIEVTYDKLSVSGFPYRFEVEIVKPVLARPGQGLAFKWTSPLMLLESLAWKPNHIVVLTGSSSLEVENTPVGNASFTIKGGKASFVSALDGDLKRASAAADGLSINLAAKPGQTSTTGHVEAHFRTEYDYPQPKAGDIGPNAPPLDSLAFSFQDVYLPGLPQNPYGNRIALWQAQIELRGITPPARLAQQMEAWRDRGGTIELLQFALKWGAYDAKATGTLALDKEMKPLGAFVVKVKGYEPLIDYLHASGYIDKDLADDAKSSLNVIVQSGRVEDEGRVSVPIVMQGGRFFFGPLPLAKLPSIAPLLTAEEPAPEAVPPAAKK